MLRSAAAPSAGWQKDVCSMSETQRGVLILLPAKQSGDDPWSVAAVPKDIPRGNLHLFKG